MEKDMVQAPGLMQTLPSALKGFGTPISSALEKDSLNLMMARYRRGGL
jgi:hypothetical protein